MFLKYIVCETIYTSKGVTDPKPNAKVRGAYGVLMEKPEGKRPRGRAREITMAFLFFNTIIEYCLFFCIKFFPMIGIDQQ
jgi:hypothetical protein